MKSDDNLQYAYEGLREFAHAIADGSDSMDEHDCNRIAEAIRIFAEENQWYLEDPYPEEWEE